MSKKFIKPIAIAIIALVAFFFLWQNMNITSTWKPNLFALKNPNKITKFTFTPNNAKQQPLSFEKINNVWYVFNNNVKYVADSASIHLLIQWAMPRLKIKLPTSDNEKKSVTRNLTLNGVKATFFEGNDPVHTIYVGGSTQSNEATYMYYPETERPCVVEIPGFQGYLTPYFNTDIQVWRSVFLFSENPNNIKLLTVTYPSKKNRSFTIQQLGDELTLLNSEGQKVDGKRGLIAGYLIMSKDFAREAGSVAGINQDATQKDAILKSTPLVIFNYTTSNNQKTSISVYPVPSGFEDVAIDAKPTETTTKQTELFWVKSSNDPYIWMAQDIVLRNRIKQLSDFLQ